MTKFDDLEGIRTEWVGNSCGRHGSYQFYKAMRYIKQSNSLKSPSHLSPNGEKILALGEFFFLQFREQDPICIGELQLLWQDKQSKNDLCSCRLYYVPETTPEGRTNKHGQDEVIALADKIVLKTTVLVSCIVQPRRWGYGVKVHPIKNLGKNHRSISPFQRFAFSNDSYQTSDVDIERKKLNKTQSEAESDGSVKVAVLSFMQYNRHMALLKRFGGDDVINDVIRSKLTILGVFTTSHPNTRIVFAKTTFQNPTMLKHEFLQQFVAPVFKGRPRKKNRKTNLIGAKSEAKINADKSKDNVGCTEANQLDLSSRRRSTRRKTTRSFVTDLLYLADDKLQKSEKKRIRLSAPEISANGKETKKDYSQNESARFDKSETVATKTRKSTRKRTKASPAPGSITAERLDQLFDYEESNSLAEAGSDDIEVQSIINNIKKEKTETASSSSSSSRGVSSLSSSNSSTGEKTPISPEFGNQSPTDSISPNTVGETDSEMTRNEFYSLSTKLNPSNKNLTSIPTDENSFYDLLHSYMKSRETPINKIPSLGFKKLDLWAFYRLSQEYGGYDMITTKRLWKHVYDRMGGNPSCTSAATCTRKHYEKLLLPFELHIKAVQKTRCMKAIKQNNLANNNGAIQKQRIKGSSPMKATRHPSDPLPQASRNISGINMKRPSMEERPVSASLPCHSTIHEETKKIEDAAISNGNMQGPNESLFNSHKKSEDNEELKLPAFLYSRHPKHRALGKTNHSSDDLKRPSTVETKNTLVKTEGNEKSLPPSKRYLQANKLSTTPILNFSRCLENMPKDLSSSSKKELNGSLKLHCELSESRRKLATSPLESRSAGLPSPDVKPAISRLTKSASPVHHVAQDNFKSNQLEGHSSFGRPMPTKFHSSRVNVVPPPFVPRKHTVFSKGLNYSEQKCKVEKESVNLNRPSHIIHNTVKRPISDELTNSKRPKFSDLGHLWDRHSPYETPKKHIPLPTLPSPRNHLSSFHHESAIKKKQQCLTPSMPRFGLDHLSNFYAKSLPHTPIDMNRYLTTSSRDTSCNSNNNRMRTFTKEIPSSPATSHKHRPVNHSHDHDSLLDKSRFSPPRSRSSSSSHRSRLVQESSNNHISLSSNPERSNSKSIATSERSVRYSPSSFPVKDIPVPSQSALRQGPNYQAGFSVNGFPLQNLSAEQPSAFFRSPINSFEKIQQLMNFQNAMSMYSKKLPLHNNVTLPTFPQHSNLNVDYNPMAMAAFLNPQLANLEALNPFLHIANWKKD